ncbi:MAG: helix-turn-helix domain-containing protein, partial [Erysipelotrichaceae bacterium]|nr:helix-turn-helix domain-containing protein [Erysipelotrichaceae bacterium]
MKKLSLKLLTDTAKSRRKALSLTQTELSKRTGINRTLLSRLEAGDFTPSVDQLIA